MKHGWKIFVAHYKSEEHWYIKFLIRGIIGIICFAILIHILKEVGIVPAQKIFDFLNQWAMVLSAGATLLLAFTAFWVIMDNRHSRGVERKERLLNEIIDWATNIVEIPAQMNFVVWQDIIKMREPKRSVYIENMTRQNVMELRRRYTILTGKKMRMKILSTDFKEYKLDIIANCVIDSLNDVISVLDKRSEGKVSDDEVNKARVLLDKRVDALVSKASNIDIRYAG